MAFQPRVLSMTLVAIFLVIFKTGTFARYIKNSEATLRDYLLDHANYSSRLRPVLRDEDTVQVSILFGVYAILQLNERDEAITTAAWITLEWLDERLSWNPIEFDGTYKIVMDVDEIWKPKIFFTNSLDNNIIDVASTEHASIIVTHEGVVQFGAPTIQSTQCPVDIRYFPFDTQLCQFGFMLGNQDSQFIKLTAEEDNSPPKLINSEWNVINTTVANYEYPYSSEETNQSSLWFTISLVCMFLERDPSFYLSNIVMPSTFICLLAFLTFLAPPDSGERISLGVSMVLGLTVFQLLIADTLPTSSKQTPILSNYLSTNFILACLTVPFSLFNINIAYGDNNLRFLKYHWIRVVILDCLPCCTGLPTLRERLKRESSDISGKSKVNLNSEDITTNTKDHEMTDRESIESSIPQLSKSEKTKLEARTVALVMDRLVLVCFVVVFCIFTVRSILQYSANPRTNIPERYC